MSSQKRNSKGGVQYAGSEYGIDQSASGPIHDKKYEGFSNLKGRDERKKQQNARAMNAKAADELDSVFIDNLQKQISTMELQIKLLKAREVDQKNQASGYETLLRDGIPLNEHFLALKNKYNNEQGELEKRAKMMEDDINQEKHENEEKRQRIRIMKNEFERLNEDFRVEKDKKTKDLKNLESKLYTEQHTKAVLIEEKKKIIAEISDLKGQNAISERAIKQAKHFTGKRDEAHKKMREEREENKEELTKLNEEIVNRSWKLDQDTRQFKDPMLLKSHTSALMQARQEANLVGIDISIAESRIKDLQGQKEMIESNLLEILTEKRAIDKENLELEYKKQGRGESEADQKKKQAEAEKEQTMRLQFNLEQQKEHAENMSEQLTVEEAKAKDMLDHKITADQTMELMEEDAAIMAAKRKANRQELIEKKNQLSVLQTANKRYAKELEELQTSNAEVIKANDKFDEQNKQLSIDINMLVQRIDVATLLKQIDLEEMKMLANNNQNMSMAFQGLLNNWDGILKKTEENLQNIT